MKKEFISSLSAVFFILLFLSFLFFKNIQLAVILSIAFLLFSMFLYISTVYGLKNIYTALLYVAIFSIQFPVFFHLGGRSIMTITTFLLFFLFFIKIVLNHYERGIKPVETTQGSMALILLFMTFISFISSLRVISGSMLSILESLKFIINFSSGIILFILVYSDRELKENNIINIILFSLVIQAVISLLQISFPGAFFPGLDKSDFMKIFGSPSARATGTIFDYELLAEWFVTGVLLGYLFYLRTKQKRYVLCIVSCCTGIICTKTRSGIILLCTAFLILLVLLFIYKKIKMKTLLLFPVLIIFTSAVLYILAPGIVTGYIDRIKLIGSEGLNRQATWNEAASLLENNIKLFGNGLADITIKNKEEPGTIIQGFSFHSLYLMLLYKIGPAGLGAYMIFWILLLKALFSSLNRYGDPDDAEYTLFFIVIIFVILLNGIKIEHIRLSHTIQFVWLLYAMSLRKIRKASITGNHDTVPGITG